MGSLRFSIKIVSKNPGLIPELAARVQDFSEPFKNIISYWTQHNMEKFGRGRGSETVGVDQDADTFWQPLTARYRKRKQAAGYADWLMVRTGDLLGTMTNENAISYFVDRMRAVFGVPLDENEAAKVSGNWSRRQAIFLDKSDRLAIKAEISKYLNLGEGYRELLFERALSSGRLRDEVAEMDASFAELIGGEA